MNMDNMYDLVKIISNAKNDNCSERHIKRVLEIYFTFTLSNELLTGNAEIIECLLWLGIYLYEQNINKKFLQKFLRKMYENELELPVCLQLGKWFYINNFPDEMVEILSNYMDNCLEEEHDEAYLMMNGFIEVENIRIPMLEYILNNVKLSYEN